ncbi:hypothetical protein [Bartonella sp. AA86SXKL]|uniref:hypothetical protein n=1 Tax=Bartonella sp. AA86SXKL TaxID=3243441 RepID=UPI0035CFAF4A
MTQLFAFSAKAPGHSKISRNSGIPAKRDKFMCQVFGFLIPIDRCVDDQNYTLSDKVISEDWQEKSMCYKTALFGGGMISSISISTFRCFLECVVNIFGWAYLVWSDETFSFEGRV